MDIIEVDPDTKEMLKSLVSFSLFCFERKAVVMFSVVVVHINSRQTASGLKIQALK